MYIRIIAYSVVNSGCTYVVMYTGDMETILYVCSCCFITNFVPGGLVKVFFSL